MDTEKLYVMMEVVRRGSIRKSANALGYTQAGLIYLLNKIEDEIGFPVLDRSSNGVSFNSDGVELQPYFTSLLAADESMRSRMSELSTDSRTKIRIGSYPSFAINILPKLLKTYKDKHPNVDIELTIGVPDLVDKLQDNYLDLIITEESYRGEFEWTPLLVDEIWVGIKRDHPLAKYDSLPLLRLLEDPMIFPSINSKHRVVLKIEEMGEAARMKRGLTVFTTEAITVMSMTAQGLGNSYVSNLWVPECPEGVVMKPITPTINRTLGIACKPRAYDNPTVRKFISHLKTIKQI